MRVSLLVFVCRSYAFFISILSLGAHRLLALPLSLFTVIFRLSLSLSLKLQLSLYSSSMDARDISTFPLSYTSDASIKKYFFPNDMRDYCEDSASIDSFKVKTCKCIIVGDIAVGKTCLINRFTHNTFSRHHKATVGVDFDVQKFNILNVPFNLQVS